MTFAMPFGQIGAMDTTTAAANEALVFYREAMATKAQTGRLGLSAPVE